MKQNEFFVIIWIQFLKDTVPSNEPFHFLLWGFGACVLEGLFSRTSDPKVMRKPLCHSMSVLWVSDGGCKGQNVQDVVMR